MTDTNYKSSSLSLKHIEAIRNYKALRTSDKMLPAKVSNKLQIAKRTEFLTVACNETGIVSILEVPAIPGFALSYTNPLAELENARGIAQRGILYLRNLDTQILAGILITLANDYSLFHYAPSDSGAQKNAILRTVGTESLIHAILTIEDMIHSGNSTYLPRLSLLMDTEVGQNGIHIRMQNWLSLVVDAIHKPDTSFYDENRTVQSERKKERRATIKGAQIAQKNLDAKQRAFTKDIKKASLLIKDLSKAEKISPKLRNFLSSIFTEYQILNMEETAKALLIGKLQDIDSIASGALIAILKTDRTGLTCKSLPSDDFFDAPATEPKETIAKVIKPSGIVETVKIIAIQTPLEANMEQETKQEVGAKTLNTTSIEKIALEKIALDSIPADKTTNSIASKPLTLAERIAAIKAAKNAGISGEQK